MKHIIFGESATGSLVAAFKKQADIIAFPDFFGEGPVQYLLTAQGLKARVNWLQQAFNVDGASWCASFQHAMAQLDTLTSADEVLIWASENAAEQFGLRLVCHILQVKQCTISVCPTYENMLYLHRERNVQMEIRTTGEVSSHQLRAMYEEQLFSALTIAQITQLAMQAQALMHSDALLRTWHHGEILPDVETRDDALILHYLTELLQETDEEFIRAPRLIGHVLGHSVHDISDTWIEYRLLTLIAQQKVHYRGNLRQMRTYEVKWSCEMHG